MKYYLIIIAVAFILFLYNAIVFRKRSREALKKKIRDNFGAAPDREYEYEEYQKLTHYFENKKDNGFYIDDITWNDLDMDSIFMLLNNTYSSSGEEYLYKMLRMPKLEETSLKEFDKLVDFFNENEEKTLGLQFKFAKLGRTKNISLSEFIERFTELKKRSNALHYLFDLLFVLSVALLFIKPAIGIIALLVMLITNVGTYYKEKAEIESYFICLKYLVDMINCGNDIKTEKTGEIKKYTDKIEEDINKLKCVSRGMYWISINGSSGSASEVIMEYIRMITHGDLIKFNKILEHVKSNLNVIDDLFENFGILESAMAVASFRKMLECKCKPEFVDTKVIKAEGVFHPLISNPVDNSINEKRSVLLTGSNASGKSTFLKTIAINSILAETIYTCTAKEFKTTFYKTYSSMSLRDDLKNSESYYMVEIKAIKRILDEINSDIPVLCFVDEVLRGTNTVERIAASTEILRVIANGNALCFAATHDIELTHLLENEFSNYHFKEEVIDDDVLFNYKLLDGKATSRNAIKLLKIMGFSQEIVDEANKMAEEFVDKSLG